MSDHFIRAGLVPLVVVLYLLASSCASSADPEVAESGGTAVEAESTSTQPRADPSASAPLTTVPDTAAPLDGRGAMGLYPERVYVPNTKSDTVDVIDPATCQVDKSLPVGDVPHHITPSYDLDEL